MYRFIKRDIYGDIEPMNICEMLVTQINKLNEPLESLTIYGRFDISALLVECVYGLDHDTITSFTEMSSIPDLEDNFFAQTTNYIFRFKAIYVEWCPDRTFYNLICTKKIDIGTVMKSHDILKAYMNEYNKRYTCVYLRGDDNTVVTKTKLELVNLINHNSSDIRCVVTIDIDDDKLYSLLRPQGIITEDTIPKIISIYAEAYTSFKDFNDKNKFTHILPRTIK